MDERERGPFTQNRVVVVSFIGCHRESCSAATLLVVLAQRQMTDDRDAARIVLCDHEECACEVRYVPSHSRNQRGVWAGVVLISSFGCDCLFCPIFVVVR